MAKKFVFEEALTRLEEIVDQLSKGDAPLDKSLELFEEGTALIKKCGQALDKAEQKVELLVKALDVPEKVPFEEVE